MNRANFIIALVLSLGIFCLTSYSQLSFTASGTQSIDFNRSIAGVNNGTFLGLGFTPDPGVGQLDSDAWAMTGMSDGTLVFGGIQIGGDFARGASLGGVSIGGLYAYTTTAGVFIQPTGTDFNPGTITLRIQNSGINNISQFGVSYNILINNDQGRSSNLDFSYSADGTTFIQAAALDYISPATSDPLGFQTVNRNTVITGLAIAPGAFFYLRWTCQDAGGTGSRDELGFDDIAVSALFAPVTISGSVSGRITDGNGSGLKFVTIMIMGSGLPEPLYATTNNFGRFKYEDIPVGHDYVLTVFSRRVEFKQPSLTVRLIDNVTDADFIGVEN
jgi:hypothetical protein